MKLCPAHRLRRRQHRPFANLRLKPVTGIAAVCFCARLHADPGWQRATHGCPLSTRPCHALTARVLTRLHATSSCCSFKLPSSLVSPEHRPASRRPETTRRTSGCGLFSWSGSAPRVSPSWSLTLHSGRRPARLRASAHRWLCVFTRLGPLQSIRCAGLRTVRRLHPNPRSPSQRARCHAVMLCGPSTAARA